MPQLHNQHCCTHPYHRSFASIHTQLAAATSQHQAGATCTPSARLQTPWLRHTMYTATPQKQGLIAQPWTIHSYVDATPRGHYHGPFTIPGASQLAALSCKRQGLLVQHPPLPHARDQLHASFNRGIHLAPPTLRACLRCPTAAAMAHAWPFVLYCTGVVKSSARLTQPRPWPHTFPHWPSCRQALATAFDYSPLSKPCIRCTCLCVAGRCGAAGRVHLQPRRPAAAPRWPIALAIC